MPRLIAGAHWFSDVVIGSGCIVLFFAGWGLFTPFHKIAIDLFMYNSSTQRRKDAKTQ